HEFIAVCLIFGGAGFFLGRVLNNGPLTLLLPVVGMGMPWQVVKIIRHRRQAMVYKYIGTALKMWAERVILSKDIAASMEYTTHELTGAEPLHSEFTETLAEIKMGVSLKEALTNLALRVDNRFLTRHIENALLAQELGTLENRRRLLAVAYRQADERERNAAELNKQLAAPKMIFYLFVGVIPPLFLFMSWGNPGYFAYLTRDALGQKIMSGAVLGLLATIWFFVRLTAPVDD
ncbi:type II secretion system F family protein, partial [bacterium]